jgi:E3 ubiquitin-protein ligase synoviolin
MYRPSSPYEFQFAGLTDAEIAEMEGRERRNIEARIQVLRNISVLLDAAVLQLQQYMSVAPQIHTE